MANIRKMQLTLASLASLFVSLIVLSGGDKAFLTSLRNFIATARLDQIDWFYEVFVEKGYLGGFGRFGKPIWSSTISKHTYGF